MSNVKHTPGPWRVEPDNSCTIITAIGNPTSQRPIRVGIATVFDGGSANGCLIAAAPELLAALEACKRELHACCYQLQGLGYGANEGSSVDRALKDSAAAIAKARGEG